MPSLVAGVLARVRARIALVPNWRAVLRHAWSIRLDVLGILLGALEFGFSVFAADPPVARGAFAAAGMLVTAASMLVRLLKQSKVSGGEA